MIVVRKHIRKRKNKVSVVRKHLRSLKSFGIKTPIKINLRHKADQHDSLAHHAMHVDKKKMRPKKHEINLDVKKIRNNGESVKDTLRHELAHVVDAELAVKNGTFKKPTDTYSQSPEGKKVIQHLRKGKNKNRSGKEIFAENLKLKMLR